MKKPIALLINDLHITKDNVLLIEDIAAQMISECVKRDISTIFLNGDIFTNRSGQPLNSLNCFKNILNKAKNKNIHVYAVAGNHDKTDSDSLDSYLNIYNGEFFHIFKDASIVNISGVDFMLIPFFSEKKWRESFENAIEKNKSGLRRNNTILISHIAVDGVMNNDGTLVESDIDSSLFTLFNKVLLGHYHNYSKIGENVYYTGSAYQNNFGEDVTRKGFTIIYDDCSIELVPSKFPKYIKEVIDVNDTTSLKNLIEKYDGEDYNHIRFVFRGKKFDCEKINVLELSKIGIDAKFEVDETLEAVEDLESNPVLEFDKKSIVKDFIAFCKDRKIANENFAFGLKLIKKIQ